MDRRTFVTSTVLAAAACRTAAVASPTVMPRRTRDAVLATPWPQRAGGYSEIAFELARRIERVSQSPLKIHLETQIGSPAEIFSKRAADFCFSPESANAAAEPAFAWFAGLPGDLGLDAAAHADWIDQSGGQSLWDAAAAPFGFKPFLALHTGETTKLWSREPLEEVNGKRLAVSGAVRGDVARALGATVVAPSNLDLARALGEGRIDGAVVGSLTEAVATGVAMAAAVAVNDPFSGRGEVLSLSIARSLWDRASQADRMTLAGTVRGVRVVTGRTIAANSKPILQMLALRGVEQLQHRPQVAAAAARVAEAVVADLACRSSQARLANAAFMAYRARQAAAA